MLEPSADLSVLLILLKASFPIVLMAAGIPFLFMLAKKVVEMFRMASDCHPDLSPVQSSSDEDIYFDARKDGYWVKSADGSKMFVSKDELYPNDVDRINLTK